MREIKFRGHNFFTKKPTYAQQILQTDDGYDFWSGDEWIHCTDCEQLIGVDKNGREIYEGDEVRPAHVLSNSLNFFATMYDLRAIENGEIVREVGK